MKEETPEGIPVYVDPELVPLLELIAAEFDEEPTPTQEDLANMIEGAALVTAHGGPPELDDIQDSIQRVLVVLGLIARAILP